MEKKTKETPAKKDAILSYDIDHNIVSSKTFIHKDLDQATFKEIFFAITGGRDSTNLWLFKQAHDEMSIKLIVCIVIPNISTMPENYFSEN